MCTRKKSNINKRVVRILFGVLFIYGYGCFYTQTLLAATCTQTAGDTAEIQTLIDSASSGDVICVPAGVHQVNTTLKDGVTLHGLELARTFFESASNATPIITGAANSIVQNLTIQGDGVGIVANNITGFIIRNVIISGTTTGIDCDSSNLTVSNVVLNDNTTAITCQNSSDLTLENTIISNNTTDRILSGSTTDTSNNNLIYNNQTQNYPAGDATSVFADPLFVNSANNDYHLQTGSPAIDKGLGADPDATAADIGAYGGDNADVIPFPVSGLNITAQGVDTVTLAWNSNNAYNLSSYNVYFDMDTSGPPYSGAAAEGASPVNTSLLSQQLTSLVYPAVILTAPTGLITVPGNESILVSWNAVTNATGYEVAYGTTSGVYTTTVDVGNSTAYQISGLTNDVDQYIVVNAYYQPTIYLAVAAVDNNSNESALINEISVGLSSSITTGPISSEVSEYPEVTVMFPDLEDEYNCFIATAAYGSSLEPQVALLRKFRNHFLLTNAPGRRFVALYYQFSPNAASFINEHGWLKFVTQVALYPVIGLAWFCLNIGPALTLFLCLFVFISLVTIGRGLRKNKCV